MTPHDRKEKLIVRRWRSGNKGIVFLMPETPWDHDGGLCESWEPVGGHGGADYNGVIQKTRPVSKLDAGRELANYCRLYPGAVGMYVLAERATAADHDRRSTLAAHLQNKAEQGT